MSELDDIQAKAKAKAKAKLRAKQEMDKLENPSLGAKMLSGAVSGGATGLPGMIMGAVGAYGDEANKVFERGAYNAGGAVADLTAKTGLPPEVAGGAGFAANLGIQAIPVLAGGMIGKPLASPLKDAGSWFMRNAIKPAQADNMSGDAKKAIQTMLDEGINATVGGMEKLRGKIMELNDEIAGAIKNSRATVGKGGVARSLVKTYNDFKKQVNPNSDMESIRNAWDEFAAHPFFQKAEAKKAALQKTVKDLEAAKNAALQDAGRFQTFAAQQENLAHGGSINVAQRSAKGTAPGQPVNSPEINVGVTGPTARSPSAYPLPDMPRNAGKYAHNIDRVPEGREAYEEAMRVYRLRTQQLTKAQTELDALKPEIPVQIAQEMKQGTYKRLNKKYGQLSDADSEAQKALARGLKEQIAHKVPGVANLNAQESRLLSTLDVAEKRVLMRLNNNKVGLGFMAENKIAAAGFMAEKSPLFQSILARMLYSTARPAATGGGVLLGGEYSRVTQN